jgi:mannitol/fructose-specific phosphotransferase system IIA component (Ntr-type)
VDVAKVTRHVRPAHCVPALEATSREEAVRELCRRFVESGTLPKAKADALATEILRRESEGTTGIGSGVAVPHAKTSLVKELLVAVGVSSRGIDFASVDGDPVHVVFLIAAPPEAVQEYLAFMKWVVSLTRSRYWTKLVRGCSTPEAIVELLEESGAGT